MISDEAKRILAAYLTGDFVPPDRLRSAIAEAGQDPEYFAFLGRELGLLAEPAEGADWCSIVREHLAAYVDTYGDDEKARRFPEIVEHLGTCRTCRESYDELRDAVENHDGVSVNSPEETLSGDDQPLAALATSGGAPDEQVAGFEWPGLLLLEGDYQEAILALALRSAVLPGVGERRVVVGRRDGTLLSIGLDYNRRPEVLLRRTTPVHAVALSDDGCVLVAADGRSLMLLDPRYPDSTQKKPLDTGLHEPPTCMALSPDGRRVLRAGNHRLIVYEILMTSRYPGGPVWGSAQVFQNSEFEGAGAIALSEDGYQAAYGRGGFVGTLNVPHVQSPDILVHTELTPFKLTPLGAHRSRVTSLDVTRGMVLSGDKGGDVVLWILGTGFARWLGDTKSAVNAVTMTPDGRYAASGHDDGATRIWDLARGCLERTLKQQAGPVLAVAISADGRTVVSGGADGTIRVWKQEAVMTATMF